MAADASQERRESVAKYKEERDSMQLQQEAKREAMAAVYSPSSASPSVSKSPEPVLSPFSSAMKAAETSVNTPVQISPIVGHATAPASPPVRTLPPPQPEARSASPKRQSRVATRLEASPEL